jgi:hypothetical protein
MNGREVWLMQVVSPGLELPAIASRFRAASAFVLPPSHVDHPHRLVLALTTLMSSEAMREELQDGDGARYVVGFCAEVWTEEYPIGDPELVPLRLDDPLLAWARQRSPTGPRGYDRAAADRFAEEHAGEYFFRHSSQLPRWPEGERVARKVRPLGDITVSAREFPWKFRLPDVPAEVIARLQEANPRIPVSPPDSWLSDLIAERGW